MEVKKKWIRKLALFAIMLALPLTGNALEDKGQETLDYESDCKLQVTVADEHSGSELSDRTEQLLKLQEAGEIEIDLYRVAVLEKDDFYDKFAYRMLPDYAGELVGGEYAESVANRMLENETAAEWAGIAQSLAAAVKVRETSADRSGTAGRYIDVPQDAAGKSVGLYLMFVRQKDKSLAESFVDVGEIATRIVSDNYTYDFSPRLVTFPWMEPDTDGKPQYPWIYERKVNLAAKYTSGYRFGDLEIVKSLDTYEIGSPVTFVFEIEARDDGGNVYYSDVIAIPFTGTGQKSARIEGRIRVGTDVTVREVYSGAAYEPTGENGTLTVRIEPGNTTNDTAQVSFANTYSDSGNDGGVIVNFFEPGEDGTGWTWSRNGILSGTAGNSADSGDSVADAED